VKIKTLDIVDFVLDFTTKSDQLSFSQNPRHLQILYLNLRPDPVNFLKKSLSLQILYLNLRPNPVNFLTKSSSQPNPINFLIKPLPLLILFGLYDQNVDKILTTTVCARLFDQTRTTF